MRLSAPPARPARRRPPPVVARHRRAGRPAPPSSRLAVKGRCEPSRTQGARGEQTGEVAALPRWGEPVDLCLPPRVRTSPPQARTQPASTGRVDKTQRKKKTPTPYRAPPWSLPRHAAADVHSRAQQLAWACTQGSTHDRWTRSLHTCLPPPPPTDPPPNGILSTRSVMTAATSSPSPSPNRERRPPLQRSGRTAGAAVDRLTHRPACGAGEAAVTGREGVSGPGARVHPVPRHLHPISWGRRRTGRSALLALCARWRGGLHELGRWRWGRGLGRQEAPAMMSLPHRQYTQYLFPICGK